MAQQALQVVDFLSRVRNTGVTVLDVRSEAEYAHAHVPTAINFPILNNEERVIVGTVYKQEGRFPAVKKGFELIGPKFHQMLTDAEKITSDRHLLLYCWRGGMRSQIMAWVLSLGGFRVELLSGGYKAFRNHTLNVLNEPRNVVVIGGKTGSGKTQMLRFLAEEGEQVIDLEAIANHKGSAFGGIGMPPQPSNEQFENLLAWHWETVSSDHPLWLENESRHIGTCMLPENIYSLIRESLLMEVDIPASVRKARIAEEYGKFPKEQLAAATSRIAKRLGPQHVQKALLLLDEGDFDGWLDIVLAYYDKLYAFGTSQRQESRVKKINVPDGDPMSAVRMLLTETKQTQNII